MIVKRSRGVASQITFVALLLVLALAGCGSGSENSAHIAPMEGPLFSQKASDWQSHGGNNAEQRFSPLDKINIGNVDGLALAWTVELDTKRGQEATPLIIDGIVYLTTAWSKVMAVDGTSGEVLWQYDPKVPGRKARDACCDVVNRGLAYKDQTLFVGALDGRLIALDAASGKPIWEVQTTDTSKPYTITGAPRIAGDLVLIGNAGAEFGVRGYVSAYNVTTGKRAWRFYTVPRPDGKPDGEASDDVLARMAQESWFDGEWEKTGGGGTVWDSIVYDPELDQIIIGTGNGTPWNHQLRSGGKGDNLFLSSIVGLDAKTGHYKWHYQVNPAESWDFTATQPIMLANLMIDGKPRKVAMQAPKNGFFYVIDRTNGQLISAKNFVDVNWATGIDLKTGRPIETKAARYGREGSLLLPSAFGAHNWYPMAFSPRTGLVYLPAQEVPMIYAEDTQYRFRAGTFNTGTFSDKNIMPDDPKEAAALRASIKGSLIAWDPVMQREVWRAEQAGAGSGGALATAGDLVFQGNVAGTFKAFNASNGKELWHFNAQTAIIGGGVSYEAGSEQYVVVLSGYGGGFGISTPLGDGTHNRPFGRILAFKLGGKAKLAAFEEPPLPAMAVISDEFTAAQIMRGKRIYETTCIWCHGSAGQSSGVTPDLRRSAALSDAALWKEITIGGMLSDRGMASFADVISQDDAEAIRAYVAKRVPKPH